MPLLRRWLPGRAAELGLAALLALVLLGLTGWNRDEPSGVGTLLVSLEMLLPAVLATVAAGLLAEDSALDLLLSVPQSASQILFQRLVSLFCFGFGAAGLLLVAGWVWEIGLPIDDGVQFAVWAAPTLWLVGLATVGALLRGHMTDGVAIALGLWGVALLTLPWVGGRCAAIPPDDACTWSLVTPFLTFLRPLDPLWPWNRLLWGGLGVLLLLWGLWLARGEERLL